MIAHFAYVPASVRFIEEAMIGIRQCQKADRRRLAASRLVFLPGPAEPDGSLKAAQPCTPSGPLLDSKRGRKLCANTHGLRIRMAELHAEPLLFSCWRQPGLVPPGKGVRRQVVTK
jgi:hypothetical protein